MHSLSEAEERGVSLEELYAERATTSAEAEAKAAEEAERAAKEAAAKKPAKKGGKDAKGGKGAAPVCEEPALPEKCALCLVRACLLYGYAGLSSILSFKFQVQLTATWISPLLSPPQ